MPQQVNRISIMAQIEGMQQDLQRLGQVFESPAVPGIYGPLLRGRFNRFAYPISGALQDLSGHIHELDCKEAWGKLSAIQDRSRQLLEQAQELLGGVAIRTTSLCRGIPEAAEKLAIHYAQCMGLSISPVVLIGTESAEDLPEQAAVKQNEMDESIRLPVGRRGIWHLPLIAHDCGYQAAKRGGYEALHQFLDEQISKVLSLLEHPPIDEDSAWLPEIREYSGPIDCREAVNGHKERSEPRLQSLVERQKIHLWHLIADAMATYLVGPAYPLSLLFLILDPNNPFLEGERAPAMDSRRSRYVPSDAKRLAVTLTILREMDSRSKADPYSVGAFSAEINLLEALWESALGSPKSVAEYMTVQKALLPWCTSLVQRLMEQFGVLCDQAIRLWRSATTELVPSIIEGSDTATNSDLPQLVNAFWCCRSRYPDQITTISRECERLIIKRHRPTGFDPIPFQAPCEAQRLLVNRLHDLESDVLELLAFLNSEEIEPGDRNAVAGRFYRLLSTHDFELKKVRKMARMGNPVGSSLIEAIRLSNCEKKRTIQKEFLDFLGGVLIRNHGFDHGICKMAEALILDYSQMTGVGWSSRTVIGNNPLFSPATDMVHLPFPDWDIWNLPLMAHEFGHILALASPPFQELLETELGVIAQGHPKSEEWEASDMKAYVERRRRHIHEFFADAFALYCQGPSFAYNVVLLHFNPFHAFTPRGNHPTHAERVELILKVLEKLNSGARLDQYEAGPYDPVLRRVRDWWFEAVSKAGAEPDSVWQFHKLKAGSLGESIYNTLDRYYHLGAQYRKEDWQHVVDATPNVLTSSVDLSRMARRNLLNLAWAGRVNHPDRVSDISRIIRPALQ